MSGVVIVELHPVLGPARAVHRIFGEGEGGGEIVPALPDPDLGPAVLAQAACQPGGHVDIGVAPIAEPPVPRPDRADRDIAAVGLVAQVSSQVGVDRSRIAGVDAVEAGIVVGLLTRVVIVGAGVAGIEPTDGQAAVAQQFLVEPAGRDAQVGAVEEGLRQAGQLRHAGTDRRALVGGQAVALEQGGHIGPGGEDPGFGDGRLDGRRARVELVVIPSRGGIAGQRAHVLQFVALVLGLEPEIEDGGDQHHAVEGDVVVIAGELCRDGGRAGRPVGFAAKELGGVPAVVLVQPETNELGNGFRVGLHAPEGLGVGIAEGIAPARADRIDEHQVGHVEQRFRVVGDVVGRCAIVLGVGEVDPLGPEGAHVQPQAARSGTSVEQEEHRPVRLGTVLQIGGGEDCRGGLAGLVLKERLADDRGVVHAHAAEHAAALGDDAVGRGRFPGGNLVALAVVPLAIARLLLGLRRGLRPGRQGGGKGEQRGNGGKRCEAHEEALCWGDA